MKELTVKTRNGITRTRYRPTWAEVDLKALEHNYIQVKRLAGKDVQMMAVVKANAYGHGTVEVSKVLEGMGVNYLGVATMDEAVNIARTCPMFNYGGQLEVRQIAELQRD